MKCEVCGAYNKSDYNKCFRCGTDLTSDNDKSNKEILNIVKNQINVEVKERSLNLNSSSISKDHSIVRAGIKLGREVYGSPTLSDQSNLSCPSLKLGPGDSYRSHTADEYIYVDEIYEGLEIYIDLLEKIM